MNLSIKPPSYISNPADCPCCTMKPVFRYRCEMCSGKYHYEDMDMTIFHLHIGWQISPGVEFFQETMQERRDRYGLPVNREVDLTLLG